MFVLLQNHFFVISFPFNVLTIEDRDRRTIEAFHKK
uniref:Uncharacterized protein n=1 Tax=Anguilla anguilla TaxID=7936 RepID=A0A0E9Q7J9_ANGAN